MQDFDCLKESLYITAAVVTIYPVSPALAIASGLIVVYYLVTNSKNDDDRQ